MLFEIILTITSSGYYGSFTTLQFTFAFQTSAFLQALQHQLETYGPKNKYIYKQHASIIQLIKDYNYLFSGQMFLEVTVSSFTPCGYGFALIKALKNKDPTAADLILSTFVAISTSFTVCFCGQEISTEVEKLHESSYQNRWYEEIPKVRRDLLVMMSVTTNPTTLNFRRYVVFNYVAFAVVIQGIYSYLSMIANFMNE
ncbi:hypothetical protein O3M35_009790 [Rhynocoris fuscipes]|uniref:Uncharacterized protein n=1 Tax=Rhynocoris fuscipes TaxID=488301 RepID=A0AAW1D5G6_9HEMI